MIQLVLYMVALYYHGTGKLKMYHSTTILFYIIYYYYHDILYMVSFDHGTTMVLP